MLCVFIAPLAYGSMTELTGKDYPPFDGFKSNDELHIGKYLEKKGFHKSAPYRIELFCEYKSDPKKKFLGKSQVHVCRYLQIEGYPGNKPYPDSDKK